MITFLKKYFAKLVFPIAWTAIIIFLLTMPGSMIPNESGFVIPQFDKLVHISLFGGFVILWNLYFGKKPWPAGKALGVFFCVYVVANGLGIGMEYVQKCCVPLRDFSESDIIADMIGAGVGYGFSNLFLTDIQKNKPL